VRAHHRRPPPPPARESLLLRLVAHHLWDPVEQAEDPNHGMPAEVETELRVKGLRRATGPHAPDTVRRRLTSWPILTRWIQLESGITTIQTSTVIDL
jgi:hypothetical protein